MDSSNSVLICVGVVCLLEKDDEVKLLKMIMYKCCEGESFIFVLCLWAYGYQNINLIVFTARCHNSSNTSKRGELTASYR